jgi:hypothetical protein
MGTYGDEESSELGAYVGEKLEEEEAPAGEKGAYWGYSGA